MRLRILAVPRASRSSVVGIHGDALKIRLAAPPVDGAANDELRRTLAQALGVARSRVQIVAGQQGRRKVVEIPDDVPLPDEWDAASTG
ncbi:MAG: DUF167 domain-containing protein [Candidatus Dadabacteria bacterium]|nr:MAG: DUF167 domain-containing protein [Candidatus Dadabacteria bacterium]